MRRAEDLSAGPESIIPEDNKEELKRQIERLVELGFHKELGMTDQEYRDSFVFPSKLTQPAGYKDRGLNFPVLVETRIPVNRQHELAGIKDYLIQGVEDEIPSDQDAPYMMWVFEGQRGEYEPAALNANFRELASLTIQHPDAVVGKKLVAAASSALPESTNAPYVNGTMQPIWVGSVYRPRAARTEDAGFQRLIRGSEVIPLSS